MSDRAAPLSFKYVLWHVALLVFMIIATGAANARAVFIAVVLAVPTIIWDLWQRIRSSEPELPSVFPDSACDAAPFLWVPTENKDALKKKHPQFILAMDQLFFDTCHYFQHELNAVPLVSFLGWPETYSALVIKERGALEKDEDYRQLLPYVLVTQRGADGLLRYFTYQRTEGVGEERLAGKVSIGLGGHIDMSSVSVNVARSTINLGTTLMQSALRELNEELRRVDKPSAPFTFDLRSADLFIAHNAGVQRVHLGIVLLAEIPAGLQFECAEPELLTLGMLTAQEIMAGVRAQKYELEVWTRLLLEKALGESGDA